MKNFPIAPCEVHPDSPTEMITLEPQPHRVCSLCPVKHNKLTQQQFQSMFQSAIGDMLQNEEWVLRRQKQVSEAAQRLKSELQREDTDILRRMLQMIEEESKNYKQAATRIRSLKQKLKGINNIVTYFRSLNQNKLFQIKMNLSNEEGLKRFHRQCGEYAGLIKRGIHNEFKRISAQLQAEQQHMSQLQKESLLSRIRECLLGRKMILLASQNGENKRERLKD